ncbi:MAG: lysophospholipid acyltransferase family protein [Bacteroidales bacterium]|nr:lysophospholipid acyltransferase family protein [Bacteroidales bacterium]
MKKALIKILSWLVLAPALLLSLLPLRVHHWFASFLAWLMCSVFHYRYQVVCTNISRAFPGMGYKEIGKVVKEYYLYIADVLCETIWGMTRSYKRIYKKGVFRIENPEVLDDAACNHNQVVLLLSHTGNWELARGIHYFHDTEPSFSDDQFVVAYHPMSSPLSEELFHTIRLLHHSAKENLVPSNKMLRFVIEKRDAKLIYVFISDQYPSKHAVFANTFMGLPTTWVNGGEAIARKLGAPVVNIYVEREARGRYVIHEKLICEDASQTPPGQVMEQYSAILEEAIKERKENWLWSHKRWKNIW